MSNISQLSERLKLQIQQEQEALESQTIDVLKRHGESLKQLSSAALNTTKTAINSESDLLLKSITSARLQSEAHISKLPQVLLIAMLWPALLTVGLCALIVLMTWIWLPAAMFNTKTETWTLSGGKTATVIISQEWTICTSNKRQYPCRINQ